MYCEYLSYRPLHGKKTLLFRSSSGCGAQSKEIYDCATPIAEAEKEAEKDEGETFFRHAPAFCALERQPPQLHGGEMFTLYSVPTLT